MATTTIHRLQQAAPIPGRLLLSFIFLMSGYGKIVGWSGTAGYMAKAGMPAVPLFLVLAIVFELGGSLMLLLGFRARFGALMLILFLIPTTLIFHHFWSFPPAEKQMQTINFMKNLAIMGGLLMVIAHGSGPMSLDRLLGRRKMIPA